MPNLEDRADCPVRIRKPVKKRFAPLTYDEKVRVARLCEENKGNISKTARETKHSPDAVSNIYRERHKYLDPVAEAKREIREGIVSTKKPNYSPIGKRTVRRTKISKHSPNIRDKVSSYTPLKKIIEELNKAQIDLTMDSLEKAIASYNLARKNGSMKTKDVPKLLAGMGLYGEKEAEEWMYTKLKTTNRTKMTEKERDYIEIKLSNMFSRDIYVSSLIKIASETGDINAVKVKPHVFFSEGSLEKYKKKLIAKTLKSIRNGEIGIRGKKMIRVYNPLEDGFHQR